jgi:SpoVK/Ycf46/Vps4 family AAA+-type ATPase
MRSALDEAFLRRLRFVVTFPFPGTVQRSAIWRRAWPAETPLGELDYARLARLSLTGGNIANVALNAAFMAAAGSVPVTMPLVLAAARAEYEKIERSINDADFVWEERPRVARPVAKKEIEVVA